MPAIADGTVDQLQRSHYDAIGAQYDIHYGDRYSRQYRDRFIHAPLFEGLALAGTRVLEALCGNGQTTAYLLAQQAIVTGLDISPQEIRTFTERWPSCSAVCGSIFNTGFPDGSFDCVTIVGGVHHLHPNINEAIREIHRILRPGGLFCFAEPHSHTIPDAVRSFWYKHDSLFAANEASVDLADLEEYARNSFSFSKRLFSGNLGYLLVLNSMIFRIPVALKKFYAPAVMTIESVLNRFVGERTSCFVICQWQKQRLCEERDVATTIADYTAAART